MKAKKQHVVQLNDCGAVSQRTRGSYSGLVMEGGSPPFIYFAW